MIALGRDDNRDAADRDPARRANMQQLIALRWIAVAGQCVTILIAEFAMGVALPLAPMFAVVALLALLNVVSRLATEQAERLANRTIFAALLGDVAGLTALLFFSGGATNPFISLYLVQVALGAVLLKPWSSWAMVGITSLCFLFLVGAHWPLLLPSRYATGTFDLYIVGALTSFALVAILLVFFVTRVNRNLRRRDAHLADLRQRAVEEDHIVRIGLLASGAAHELGTPLASISVILNDWQRVPAIARDPETAEELRDMQIALARCKAIVTNILASAGEARGEHPEITSLHRFLNDLVEEWRTLHGDLLIFENLSGPDQPIVSDTALKQVIWNVLDNAQQASESQVTLFARRDGAMLELEVRDDGPGFSEAMLADFGKPYRSTKGRAGAGLGLFLVVNAMRKLGGEVEARNRPGGGAVVRLSLPMRVLACTGDATDAG